VKTKVKMNAKRSSQYTELLWNKSKIFFKNLFRPSLSLGQAKVEKRRILF